MALDDAGALHVLYPSHAVGEQPEEKDLNFETIFMRENGIDLYFTPGVCSVRDHLCHHLRDWVLPLENRPGEEAADLQEGTPHHEGVAVDGEVQSVHNLNSQILQNQKLYMGKQHQKIFSLNKLVNFILQAYQ